MAMLQLTPCCKEYLWGGNRLIKEYNKRYEGESLAETWELSCHPDGPSSIKNGIYAGMTLQEFIKEAGRDVLGTNCGRFQEFPILIKFIDAKDNLSIQVHPDNYYALQNERQYGKTELWYVMDCEEGAFLYYGFKKQIDKKEFAKRIENNTLLEVLNAVPVQKGDILFIEAGTIHAIGKDILIAEIQQNSNVTYRVYDYGRVGKDGKKRDLHIEKALEVTNRVPILRSKSSTPHIAKCDYFTVDKLNLDGTVMKRMSGLIGAESFASILFLEGEGEIRCGYEVLPYKKGDSFFLAAGSGEYEVTGKCEALVTTIDKKTNPIKIGIEMSGADVRIGLVNAEQKVLGQVYLERNESVPWQQEIADISRNVLELLERMQLSLDQCIGVGVSVAGVVDQVNGVVLSSESMQWCNIPLSDELKKHLPVPVSIRRIDECTILGAAALV